MELGLSASAQQNWVTAFGLSGLVTVRAAQEWVEWKGGRLSCQDPVGGDWAAVSVRLGCPAAVLPESLPAVRCFWFPRGGMCYEFS